MTDEICSLRVFTAYNLSRKRKAVVRNLLKVCHLMFCQESPMIAFLCIRASLGCNIADRSMESLDR